MSQVGAFPGMNSNRRTIRAQVNPMDKSTIVSIYPKYIKEVKHTIQPGLFELFPGSYGKPSILVVGSSSWWKDIDDTQPLLEIPNGSVQVADSVVKDYCNGLLGCNMSDCMPGLFWIPGSFSVIEVITNHNNLLIKAKKNQDRFFQALVKLADGLWARTNGNPLVVAEDMRMAARELGLINKDWMKDFTLLQKVNCPACSTMITADIIVCPNCKVILNKKKFEELGMSFAG